MLLILKKTQKIVGCAVLSLCASPLLAANNTFVRQLVVSPQINQPATGTVTVFDNPTGPDNVAIQVQGLTPNTRYTVMLANSPVDGALPTQLVREYMTNNTGAATFTFKTEVTNAFSAANQMLENQQGVADVLAAGAFAMGANTIPLNWLRIHEADPTNNVGLPATVFGASEYEMGGRHVMSTSQPLP